jgi:hypothetical protein
MHGGNCSCGSGVAPVSFGVSPFARPGKTSVVRAGTTCCSAPNISAGMELLKSSIPSCRTGATLASAKPEDPSFGLPCCALVGTANVEASKPPVCCGLLAEGASGFLLSVVAEPEGSYLPGAEPGGCCVSKAAKPEDFCALGATKPEGFCVPRAANPEGFSEPKARPEGL